MTATTLRDYLTKSTGGHTSEYPPPWMAGMIARVQESVAPASSAMTALLAEEGIMCGLTRTDFILHTQLPEEDLCDRIADFYSAKGFSTRRDNLGLSFRHGQVQISVTETELEEGSYVISEKVSMYEDVSALPSAPRH